MLIYVMCYLPTFSLSNALCFHHIKDTKKDFPRVRVWGTISWIVAGLFVGWLEVEDQAVPFQIAASCSIIQAFYCLTLPATPPKPRTGISLWQSLNEPEVKTLLRDSSLVVMVISIGLICIPHAYYYSFVNPFLNELGVTNAAGKMSLGQVSEIVFMLSLPWFFKIWRLKTILFIGLFVWGARYGLFILGIHFQSEWWFLVALSLHGLAYIFSMLSAQIYLDSRVPAHLRSTGQGFYSLLTLGVGVFIGSYLAGEQVSYYTLDNGMHDWASIWLFPTIFGVVVSILFWFSFRGRQKA
jgi:nucleoside transporter